MSISYTDDINESTKIKVVGVGGGGGNAVNRMIEDGITNVDFIAMNTDLQVLVRSKAQETVQLGVKMTAGRGAGANPEIGRRSAEESVEDIEKALDGAQMVFLTAGMGGGTGTGAIPVIAKVAREKKILTIGVVTKPFAFEGKRKMIAAESGIAALLDYVDSLIVVPNERLKQVSKEKITLQNAFAQADAVLQQGIVSIASLINVTSFINLDFADVCSVMSNAGYAHMGVGMATGSGKAITAAEQALHSPLIETDVCNAGGVIINFTASPDISLEDIEEAAAHITEAASEDANVIWGVSFDDKLKDTLVVTLIATGFTDENGKSLKREENKKTGMLYDVPAPKPVFSSDAQVRKIETANASRGCTAKQAPSVDEPNLPLPFDDMQDILPQVETFVDMTNRHYEEKINETPIQPVNHEEYEEQEKKNDPLAELRRFWMK